MNVLISGGAKNGKSYYAQTIARQMAEEKRGSGDACGSGGKRPLYYIATMIPHDEEDHARIRRHVAERAGWGFETLERGKDLMGLLQRETAEGKTCSRTECGKQPEEDSTEAPATEPLAKKTSPGIDPRGVFLLDSVTALLSNEMFREDGSFDPNAAERVAADCTAFARGTGNTVFVSDYIYGDAQRYDTMTEEYRRGLAAVDRALAKACDRVIEVSAGTIEDWKTPADEG